MSTVAAYVYREGQRVRSVSIDEPGSLDLEDGEFIWIGLATPSMEEMRALQLRFALHPLAVEDALKAHQLPKVDVYGDQLFVVAPTAHLHDDAISYGETHIFVGPRHIITVRHHSDRGHGELRAQLEAAPTLLRHGVDYVLHAVLDFVVDGYLPIVLSVEESVLKMEQRALDTFLDRAEITRIFSLRRELMKFQRLLGPMGEVASRLEHMDSPCLDAEVRPYFRDVLDHVRHVESMVEGLRDVLGSVFEVSALLEQQRQGTTTRMLAAWAAILAVPTAIAGIYGMNFENIPELKWRYGYFAVVGLIAVLCSVLFARFKRARWI